MQLRFSCVLLLSLALGGVSTASADLLVWDQPSLISNVWEGVYTSPYWAWDMSTPPSGELISIYCLDYNHQVAPPYEWEANFQPLDLSHTALFQYGTSFGTLQEAYARYVAAAWLMHNIQELELTNPPDKRLKDSESQVAAWLLFADPAHIAELNAKIAASGTQFSTGVANLYNQALAASSTWTPDPQWQVVTVDTAWVAAHQPGVPVQEFLFYDPPAVPEPAAVLLFATVAGFLVARRIRQARC